MFPTTPPLLDLNLPNSPVRTQALVEELAAIYDAFKQVNEFLAFSSSIVPGFTDLVVGSIYYRSDTPNTISLTPELASGTIRQEVGIAISPTELFVRLGIPYVNP